MVEEDQSFQMKLVEMKTFIIALDFTTCAEGEEYPCIHSCDSSDFMNQGKFECFILKYTNEKDPPC